jgi:hypothetical protein
MTEFGRPRPMATFGGFLVATAALVLTVLAYTKGFFASSGLSGLFGVVIGLIVIGVALIGVQPNLQLRAFGKGLLIGGSVGFALMIAFLVMIMIAMSRMQF